MKPSNRTSTWNEEREEVWQSVVEAMGAPHVDAERESACRFLLHHLSTWPRNISVMMYS